MEDGLQKKVTETYTIDALSFTEAEQRIMEEMSSYISGQIDIKDIKRKDPERRHRYKVRVVPPLRKITLKRVWHEYTLHDKETRETLNLGLKDADLSKYASIMYDRGSLGYESSLKEHNIDFVQDNRKFSELTLIAEISRYLNIPCLTISKVLRESADGISTILETVNRYNDVLYDLVIPGVFYSLKEIVSELRTEEKEVVLLKEPKDGNDFYEFSADEDLVLSNTYRGFTPAQVEKSFHADTYCFDSRPEKECFLQYIRSNKVAEIYFTGMFTSNQGELSVHYYDPESGRIRQYYPDFLAKMQDGSYQLIEVKGDDKIDDVVVKAKKAAAEEIATASEIKYIMYAGSRVMKTKVLEDVSSDCAETIPF